MSKISPLIKSRLKQALVFCQNGELINAKKIYDDLIKVIPKNIEVLTNLGTIELQLNNTKSGIKYLKKSINENQNQPHAYLNLANGLLDDESYEEAISIYDRVIQKYPNHADAYYNKGRALRIVKRYSDAIQSYSISIKLQPNFYLVYNNRGLIFHEMKDYQNALADYEASLLVNPTFIEAYYNRGITLHDLKRYEEALESYSRALELKPDYPDAHYNLGVLNLTIKNFAIGWDFYEKRFLTKNWQAKSLEKFRKEKWLDFNCKNKTILIVSEQGIGDEIFYSKMLADVDATHNKIIALVDPRLINLLERTYPKIKFSSIDKKLEGIAYDYYLSIGSLGSVYRKSYSSIIENNNFVYKTNERINKKLKDQLKTENKYLCGISWKSKNNQFGLSKSIDLESLLPIFNIPNITFINLQYGDISNEIESLFADYGVKIKAVHEIDNLNNIDGLASLINACDFVITTSNVTAHISGAIGKETYVLLPYGNGKVWYWHEGVGKSIWYPTLNLFSQPDINNWAAPISEIYNEIIKK